MNSDNFYLCQLKEIGKDIHTYRTTIQQIVLKENQEILQIKRIFGFNDESNECIICMNNMKNAVILPCR